MTKTSSGCACGKRIKEALRFLDAIKKKGNPIWLAKDYVVISHDQYMELIRRSNINDISKRHDTMEQKKKK